MNKRLMAGIGAAAALVFSLGATQAFAAGTPAASQNTAAAQPRQANMAISEQSGGIPLRVIGDEVTGSSGAMHGKGFGEKRVLSETDQAQHEENLNMFIESLTGEQKALYDAMAAKMAKPAEGRQPIRPDEASIAEMHETVNAFIESLSETQKTAYGELFGMKNRGFAMNQTLPGSRKELTDEERSQMELARTQMEEKLNTFILSLSAEQKALYDATIPQITKTAEGQQPIRPDEGTIQAMKEKQDAFVASLTESQKAAYEELFGKHGRTFGMHPRSFSQGGEQN